MGGSRSQAHRCSGLSRSNPTRLAPRCHPAMVHPSSHLTCSACSCAQHVAGGGSSRNSRGGGCREAGARWRCGSGSASASRAVTRAATARRQALGGRAGWASAVGGGACSYPWMRAGTSTQACVPGAREGVQEGISG